MNIEELKPQAEQLIQHVIEWATSPQFYAQCAMIAGAIILAFIASGILKRFFSPPATPQQPGTAGKFRNFIYKLRNIIFPLVTVLLLGIAVELGENTVQQSWLIRIAQGLSVVSFIYSIISNFVDSSAVRSFAKWIAIPIAILHVFGWLDDVTGYLESISLQVGNIKLSLYALVRVIIFGSILFWLGRLSNIKGQQFIRNQNKLESRAREAYAKLYEIAIFIIIFILILQVMGINITTLAVFGGALGVGLGFGLQSIASNFISGLIILLDRSLTVGDYIELEEGQMGTIRALNMRSTILETYDGKDIVVPNEKFITTSFINWTHKNIKQRYSLEFQVAYDTDIEKLVVLLREVVASHPKVLSGQQATLEEQPDAEISGFGDSGIDILIEYWMEGVDDGINRIGADLNMMIWKALKENNVEIPFPQREVKILQS